jgi:hypothetical protein
MVKPCRSPPKASTGEQKGESHAHRTPRWNSHVSNINPAVSGIQYLNKAAVRRELHWPEFGDHNSKAAKATQKENGSSEPNSSTFIR